VGADRKDESWQLSEQRNGRKRSLLAQERSRDTREAIIRAALELWREHGFGAGADDPTAEEIAERAGISKATFYLHFARKDDILLATAWVTTKVFYEDALQALLAGGPVEDILDDVTVRLSRRIENVPRLVQQRMLRAQSALRKPTPRRDDAEHFGFDRGFALILLQAQQSGDIPQTLPAAVLGSMFEAMAYQTIREWAYDPDADLLTMLRTRFAVLLAGARAVTPAALSRR
jgi:AcrR family transcriptional regulator